MLIVIPIIGVFLLLVAVLNLAGLAFIEASLLISPIAVAVRYSLMAVAGLGFILFRKWGVFVYLSSFAINWINYFTVYDGQVSAGPLWLSFPIPLGVCVVSYLSWDRLK